MLDATIALDISVLVILVVKKWFSRSIRTVSSSSAFYTRWLRDPAFPHILTPEMRCTQ